MKLYATGEVLNTGSSKESFHMYNVRVVGMVHLGGNNADNTFGWSGLKLVVNQDDSLFVMDFPESVKITTNDDLFIAEGDRVWWPSIDDAGKFDLYIYDKDWLSHIE